MTFSARSPDLHRLSFGRESFAALGPLALLGNASYPVSVRRPADSFPASFSAPVTLGALRFPWIATTNSPGDSHPQVTSHAGHTKKTPGPLPRTGRFMEPAGVKPVAARRAPLDL